MKDAYSFDLDDAGQRESYGPTGPRTSGSSTGSGCEHTMVPAVAGATGGSDSEEFLAATPVGEDTYVGCPACGYAANTEAVTTPAPPPTRFAPTRGPRCSTHRRPRRSPRWCRS